MSAQAVADISAQCEALLGVSKTGRERCEAKAKWLVQGSLRYCGQHAWNKERTPLGEVPPTWVRFEEPMPAPTSIPVAVKKTQPQPVPLPPMGLMANTLAELVAFAAKGVSGRSTQPIQHNVLLELAGDEARVTGSDLEFVQVETWTPGFREEDVTLRFTLPPKTFREALEQQGKKTTLNLRLAGQLEDYYTCNDCGREIKQVNKGTSFRPLPVYPCECGAEHKTAALAHRRNEGSSCLILSAGGSELELRGLPAQDFEKFSVGEGNMAQLPLSDLRLTMEVAAAVSNDQTRPTLRGLALMRRNDRTSIMATDTWRLAIADLPLSWESDGDLTVIIPRETLTVVSSRLGRLEKANAEVKVIVSEKAISFGGACWRISGRAIEGTFPNYESILPTEPLPNIVKVRTEQLRPAVLRAALVAKYDGDSISLASNYRDELVVSSECDCLGSFIENMEAEIGQADPVWMSWRMLKDCLPKYGEAQLSWRAYGTNGNKDLGLVKVTTGSPVSWVFNTHKPPGWVPKQEAGTETIA